MTMRSQHFYHYSLGENIKGVFLIHLSLQMSSSVIMNGHMEKKSTAIGIIVDVDGG